MNFKKIFTAVSLLFFVSGANADSHAVDCSIVSGEDKSVKTVNFETVESFLNIKVAEVLEKNGLEYVVSKRDDSQSLTLLIGRKNPDGSTDGVLSTSSKSPSFWHIENDVTISCGWR